MTVWLCGNSHVGALQRGLAAHGGDEVPLRIFPFGNGIWETEEFSTVSAGRVILTRPEYAENVEKHTGKRHFDHGDVWGLCLGTHNARIYRLDFWSGAAPSGIARGDARPISNGVLDAMILRDQRHIRTFMTRLKEQSVPFFVVSCPPPRQDHPCFRQGIRRETVAYIDRRSRTLFRDWLAGRRVGFVDIPPDAVTADGFLKPAYNAPDRPDGAKDPHHANGDYGRLMIRRIIDYIRTRPADIGEILADAV